MRDSHRSVVYQAEGVVGRLWDHDQDGPATVDFHGSQLVLPVQRRFGDVSGVRRYCDAAAALLPAGVPPVQVQAARSERRATWHWPGLIRIPDQEWSLREMVVIHELAHHVAAHTGVGEPSHGRGFVLTYLQLLQGLAGPEVPLLLTAALFEAGFPFPLREPT